MQRRSSRAAVALALITLALSLFSSSALAQGSGSDPVAATELFRQGREALSAGDVATARARFEESLRLDEKVGTLLNLAECEEKLSLFAVARQHLQRALDLAVAQGDDRVPLVRSRLEAINPRVPRLTIRLASGAPGGLTVRRDGFVIGEGALGVALPVEIGRHVVVVEGAGRKPQSHEIALAVGESRELVVAPGDPLPGAAIGPHEREERTSAAARAEAPAGSSLQRTIGLAVAGGGLVALGVGTVFGVSALSKNADSDERCIGDVCDRAGKELRDDARAAGDLSTMFFVGGAALVVGGGILFFTAPRSSGGGGVALSPFLTPSSAGLSLRGGLL